MSNYIIVDGELYHHGVKGMKWGVRRDRRVAKYRSKAKDTRYSEKKRQRYAAKATKLKNMTYEEHVEKTKKGVGIGMTAVGTALMAVGAIGYAKYASSGNGKARIDAGKQVVPYTFEPEWIKGSNW